SGSHNMKIIFDYYHLNDIQYPCILQQFVNHGGILLKVFLIGNTDENNNHNGNNFYVVQRGSIRNFTTLTTTQPNETIAFHTKEVSSAQSCSPLNNNENSNNLIFDEKAIKDIANKIQMKFKLNLLSIDIISDCSTKQYAVIDVNYFPGYEGLNGLNERLFYLCIRLLKQQQQKPK
ncbi:unnamed protein product, partial [Didymodactylos carnosus]